MKKRRAICPVDCMSWFCSPAGQWALVKYCLADWISQVADIIFFFVKKVDVFWWGVGNLTKYILYMSFARFRLYSALSVVHACMILCIVRYWILIFSTRVGVLCTLLYRPMDRAILYIGIRTRRIYIYLYIQTIYNNIIKIKIIKTNLYLLRRQK
jgi:hypothetical protein